MANGGDRHAEDNRTERSKVLLRRLVLVEGGPVHEASSVEAEIHLGPPWSLAGTHRHRLTAGPHDADRRPKDPGVADTSFLVMLRLVLSLYVVEIESHGTDF